MWAAMAGQVSSSIPRLHPYEMPYRWAVIESVNEKIGGCYPWLQLSSMSPCLSPMTTVCDHD